MSLFEEDPPSVVAAATAEDSDDSGVHLKQTRSSDYEADSSSTYEPPDEKISSPRRIHHNEEDLRTEGCLLWAKIRGFSYWPGVITVDPFEGITTKVIPSSGKRKVHVHFLGYDNLRAWVPESDLMPYEGFGKFKEHAHQFPKRQKDFVPGKKFRNIFERAVKDAEAAMVIPVSLRLEKLGFVYIPTIVDGSAQKVLTKRKNSTNRGKQSKTNPPVKRRQRNKKPSAGKEEILEPQNDDSDLFSDAEESSVNELSTKESVPKLGSLIWGHMAGFPYWPCFVTRSPDGDYIRESKNKVSVHVQFFNWNDESGWVTKTIPWCSMAEFRSLAKESMKNDEGGSSVDWCPVGKMYHKWKNAALEAGSTSLLSRRERHNRYVVKSDKRLLTSRQKTQRERRRENQAQKFQSPPPPTICTSTRLPPGWVIRIYKEEDYGEEARTEYQSPDGAVFLSIENAISYLFQQNNSGSRKRSYSSPGGCIQTTHSSFSSLCNLPPGPASNKRRSDAGWFINESDALRYPSTPLRPQVGYLDLDDTIAYEEDASLPRGWSVKRIKRGPVAQVLYLSPGSFTKNGTTQRRREFNSKVSAASYFEGMGHPAVELEHVIATGMLQCLSRRSLFKVDEYLNYRLRESPLLRKIVSPSFVRLVPLSLEAIQNAKEKKN